MNVSEIAALQKIAVKPMAWRMLNGMDGIGLMFTYVDPERGEWEDVKTRRGVPKRYKTYNAAISDIKKVQDQAVIMME